MQAIERKSLNEWGREELLKLPARDWQEESVYDSVLLLSTRRKHDSGWAAIAIIGVRDGQPVEIASQCSDDIEWKLPEPQRITSDFAIGQMRMDCAFRSGAMHAWARRGQFRVGCAISSIEIELISIA